jgi:hypothetical protein
MNIVAGNAHDAMDCGKKTSNCGIDLVFNTPCLDVYVRSKLFVVGGTTPEPTEKLRVQLAPNILAEPNNNVTLPRVQLKPKQRFQVDDSVYRILTIQDDVVNAVSVFGPTRGNAVQFTREQVTLAVHNRLFS